MTLPAETLADLEPELQAIACVFKCNEEYIDKKAYEIVGKQIKGATARLAELIGKSVDWIEDRARAYKLSLDLQSEFGKASESVGGQLPDSFIVAVARKYDPDGTDPDKLNLGEAFEKLCDFTRPQPDGEKWNIDAVRASLPHTSKDPDYSQMIGWVEKRLPHLMKPVLLGLSETQKQIALEIADCCRRVGELVRQFREAG